MQVSTNAPLDAATFDTAISFLNGAPEVSATWARDNLGRFDFVDVREPHELEGPLGAADGVENVPLGEFLDAVRDRDASRPLVLICRSGRRSALAADAARRAGLEHVASVEGGTIAWNQEVLGHTNIHATEKQANADNLADAVFNANGIPEVSAQWVHKNLGRFRLIDVRQPDELRLMGRVLQSENVPLGQLMQAARDWDRDTPLVVMCKSGGRSARGTLALMQRGFTNVASMEGGMMGWSRSGLPVA